MVHCSTDNKTRLSGDTEGCHSGLDILDVFNIFPSGNMMQLFFFDSAPHILIFLFYIKLLLVQETRSSI